MESSRGGPLTTFIMMLPLIVVPTVAMLKPAGNPVGMVTDFLSASPEGDAAEADAMAQPGDFTDADEFSDFFTDEGSASPQTVGLQADDSPFHEEIPTGNDSALMNEVMNDFAPEFSNDSGPLGDDFPFPDRSSDAFSQHDSRASGAQPAGANTVSRMNRLLGQVKQTGASEVMWFQPGPMSHGFIAFFHNMGDGRILRFEGVASTKEAAVEYVLFQIQQRQRR